MNRRSCLHQMGLILAITLVAVAPAMAADFAAVTIFDGIVDFAPTERGIFDLSVNGPGDYHFAERFEGNPSFGAAGLADGTYVFELRRVPTSPKVRGADEAGSTRPKDSAQTGHFAVSNGAFVTEAIEEPGQRGSDNLLIGIAPEGIGALLTTQDVCYADDLIVDGSLCVGFDCTCNYSFGFDTLVLKENNLRVFFDDTSAAGSFPRNDWRILINDSANGGASYFGVEDSTGGRRVFTLEAGAPSHSLYVDDGGRLGLGTSTPSVEVHTVDGDTPTLRLQQDGSSGFGPQTWDVAGNETNFFVRDVTNGSTLPFRIQPDAPTNVLTLRADGRVGIGTWSPSFAVHQLTNSSTNAQFVAERTSGARTILAGTASAGFFGTLNNFPLRLTVNNAQRMEIDTSGSVNMSTGGGTYNSATGAWVDGSSRSFKENIEPLGGDEAASTLSALAPVKFNFKGSDESKVGFIAEDVPELVAENSRKGLSSMDIVAVLTKVVQRQQTLVQEQQAAIEALEARLEALEESN